MNFAIDYAPLATSKGLRWEDGSSPEEFELPYNRRDKEESEKIRLAFLKGLGPQDTLWLEMGSTHRFALSAYRAGAQVRRVSGHWTKMTREGLGLAKDQQTVVLHKLALAQSDYFYPYQETDERIAEVGMVASAYYVVQDLRKRAVQRLEAVRRDLYLVEPIGEVDVELSVNRQLARLVYFQGVMAEHPEWKLEKLVKEMYEDIEQIFYSRLDQLISRLPVYKGVFKHIPQCGPAISAIIIWRMADVDFFPTEPALKHYGGSHLNGDGTPPVRKKGVQGSWDVRLKQAFWQFGQGTYTYGRADEPWKQALLKRLEFEKSKMLPGDEKASAKALEVIRKNRACWWTSQKFAEHIWRRWHTFKAGGEYLPPDFECLRTS